MSDAPPPRPPDEPDPSYPVYPSFPQPGSSSPDAGGYAPYPGPGGYDGHTPMEPRATTAMVLGIVGIVLGLPICGLGALVGPFALVLGRRSMRAIDASGGQFSGRGRALTGFILGIITTALLAIYVLGIVIFAVDR